MTLGEYTLGVTDTDEPFGVHNDRPHIAMMLRGGKTGLRAELARKFFAVNDAVPSQQALADACMVLEGRAQQETERVVYLRVAEAGGRVYIDMGDTTGRVIEIGGGQWHFVDSAPVLFRRTKLTGAMPYPHPGELSRLWDFVPIATSDQPMLLAFMVQALIQADVPHPILLLLAEQGAAKSSITRAVVSLLDPSPVPLRQPPRDQTGWVTAASASWVVALDNLSGNLPEWLSDSLCRASTGDGDVRRQLYTDCDVAVVRFRRVVIGNGVDVVVDRGDLGERLLPVDLKRPAKRRSEEDLAQDWAEAHPHIMGALLDLAAKVHHRLPAVVVDDLPRMADFAKVLAAVDEVLNTEGLARYGERSKRVAADTLDHPFINELVDRRLAFEDQSSAEILAALKPSAPDWKRPAEWPKNARAVTGQLTRHAPALREQGWFIEDDASRNRRNRVQWTIRPPENGREPDSPDSQTRDEGDTCSSDLLRDCELEREEPASHSSGLTRYNSHLPDNSRHEELLTCEDELASHASHENAPSLVVSSAPRKPLCPRCERIPARDDSGLCDYCTTRVQAVAAASGGNP